MSMPAARVNSTMTLAELLGGIATAPELGINGIASDTRDLHEGSVFLACPGINSHGLDYVPQAIASGAAAIVYDADSGSTVAEFAVPMIRVSGLRDKLGEIANRFFDAPSQSVRVIGVTGTNGKTTVAWLLSQSLQLLGQSCAYAGTLGFGIDAVDPEEGLTTPDVIELHRRLALFRDGGAGLAAIEVSSHALSQKRIDGIALDAAIFTNLSRDHLDYHGSMRAYAEAKATLFTEYAPRRSIINRDSRFGSELAQRLGSETIVVSADPNWNPARDAFLCLRSATAISGGSDLAVESTWGEASFSLPLPGRFNIENALVVLAFLLSDGVSLRDACRVLSRVSAPPGRMELVARRDGPAVYIDYAHTPHALDVVLQALKPHCAGALWCVFGCGGDRDQGKRPLMATVSEQHADRIVVTTDNPRGENPASIIDQIAAGFSDRAETTMIEDRATAIAWAIEQAQDEDTILIAGKGSRRLPADRRRAARLLGLRGCRGESRRARNARGGRRVMSTLAAAAGCMNGTLHGQDGRFDGVSTDTRTIGAGELFFALEGPNFDGRDYVTTAGEKGAAGAVVSALVDDVQSIPQLVVGDSRRALGQLGSAWRDRLGTTVIGITGSNGKTTLKEMTSACLSRVAPTLATAGNLNNDIGMPLMLTRIEDSHRFAVLEMGANHVGEIAYLTSIARPDIVALTNAGEAHLEGFGSVDGIARGKGEILSGEYRPRAAVLNADDYYFEYWSTLVEDVQLVSFGIDNEAVVSASEIEAEAGASTFRLELPGASTTIRLPIAGRHNVRNACAAAAIAIAAGVQIDDIKAALQSVEPVPRQAEPRPRPGRCNSLRRQLQRQPLERGCSCRVPCNASWPTACWCWVTCSNSVTKRLVSTVRPAKRYVPPESTACSQPVACRATPWTVSATVRPGTRMSTYSWGALRGDMRSDLNVLVKGSRGMQMERVVAAIRADEQGEN